MQQRFRAQWTTGHINIYWKDAIRSLYHRVIVEDAPIAGTIPHFGSKIHALQESRHEPLVRGQLDVLDLLLDLLRLAS